ncbi:MAG: DNA methyltransferase [Planctomycetota bacterium]
MKQVDTRIRELKSKYKKTSRPICFSFRNFCSKWKWAKRSDVYTHHLHKYPAKLLSYIPIFFLSRTPQNKHEVVLDPFAGSGTVLLESIAHPYYKRNCLGIEINPLARLISKVKTTPLDDDKLRLRKKDLLNRLNNKNIKPVIPYYKNLSLWFTRRAQNKLGKLRACIDRMKNDDYKDFFLVCFSSIIRKVALADPNIPPPVILKPLKYKKNRQKFISLKRFLNDNQNPNVYNTFKDSIEKNQYRIKSLSAINGVQAKIIWDDARNPKMGTLLNRGDIKKTDSKEIKNNSIDLIITSPPYITAQKYVRTTKLELLWLGLVDSQSIMKLDKATIGTEVVRRSDEIIETNISEIDNLFKKVAHISLNRASMMNKYFNDMAIVMKNAYRILKNGREMILVVGNNTVCGYNVKTHKMLEKIGENAGFKTEFIIKDKIASRGMLTKRHGSGGLIENEYILVLKK